MKRALPLLLVLLLLGLLLALLVEQPDEDPALSPGPTTTERVEPARTNLPGASTPGEGASAGSSGAARQTIRPPALHVSAQGAGGAAPPAGVQVTVLPEEEGHPKRHFELAGISTKVPVRPGGWTVRFEAQGYAPDSVEVTVGPGEDLPVVGTLLEYAKVTARIVDVYGQPGGDGRLWFLKPGQAMPDGPWEEHQIPSARFGRSGELPPIKILPGTYKVVFGSYSNTRFEQEVSFYHDRETALKVVAGGRSHVTVLLDQPIDQRQVFVHLEEDKNERKREKDNKRREESPSESTRRSQERDQKRDQELIDKGMGWRLEKWKSISRARMEDIVGTMSRVRSSSKLRVVLEVDKVLYGTEPFVVLERDQAYLLEVQVPTPLLTRKDLAKIEGMPDGRRVPLPLTATLRLDDGLSTSGEGIFVE